eukprot:gene13318-biopygen9554
MRNGAPRAGQACSPRPAAETSAHPSVVLLCPPPAFLCPAVQNPLCCPFFLLRCATPFFLRGLRLKTCWDWDGGTVPRPACHSGVRDAADGELAAAASAALDPAHRFDCNGFPMSKTQAFPTRSLGTTSLGRCCTRGGAVISPERCSPSDRTCPRRWQRCIIL